MAFVSRAERSLDYGHKGTHLGPGAYLSQPQPQSSRAYAPFSSTTERTFHSPLYTPGPGSYSFSKLPADSLVDRGKLYGPLASKDARFKEKKRETAPGPGSYETASAGVKARKPPVKQEWNAMNWLRLPSAPSIPAPGQAFGYDETANGELVMQSNPEKVYAGTGKDSVGPGQYNAKKPDEVWKARGPAWHKSRAKRIVATAPDSKVGPGSYNEFQLNLAPMYKYKPNAVFVSGTQRETQVEEPLLEEEQWKEPLPGPGHYHSEVQSSFRPKLVPSRLQFFGSTSARFQAKQPPHPNLGPGVYGDLRKPLISKPNSESNVPFSAKDLRFRARPSTNPGPGSYKEMPFSEDSKRRTWGRQGVFGTTEKRFVGAVPVSTAPGPGYYPSDAAKRIGTHNSARKKPLSVFASKTNRVADMKSEGPAPGQYELKSEFQQSRTVSGTGNPLLAGAAEKHMEAPFNSKSSRFGSQGEAMDSLGPGCYDPKVARLHPVFLPKVRARQAPRFKGKESAQPGPGAYEEEGSSWTKRSYNVLFTEFV